MSSIMLPSRLRGCAISTAYSHYLEFNITSVSTEDVRLLKWFCWSVKFSLILKVLLNPIRTEHLMFFINISRIIIYNSCLSCWIYIFCYWETIFVYYSDQHTRNSWREWHTDHVSYLFVCQKRSVHLLQVYLCDFSLMIIYRISLQLLSRFDSWDCSNLNLTIQTALLPPISLPEH